MHSYSLASSPFLTVESKQEPSHSKKEPVLTQIKEDKSIYQSSHHEPIPPINSGKVVEFMDSSVESLLKEQIFLMKFILLFLGFMLLSNILAKKN